MPAALPFLQIGTGSIEQSEALSHVLLQRGIDHKVLNARPELAAVEASVVAQAGRPGSVTIATNMAGRGTDILLGGNPALLSALAITSLVKGVLGHAGEVKRAASAP